MMSHEIRTPLNVILGAQELLGDNALDGIQKKYLDLGTAAGESLLTLISDILDLTKVEAGRLELEALIFNAIELVNVCVELLSVKAKEKGLALAVEIASDLNPC